MTISSSSTGNRIYRIAETVQRVGVCSMTIRRWEESGKFPRRFKLTPDGAAVGHDADEVDQWIAERRASRDAA